MSDVEREAFESWAVQRRNLHDLPYFVMKNEIGKYVDKGANDAWEVWQAARAHGGEVEPVAWMWDHLKSRNVTTDKAMADMLQADFGGVTPLYTHPPSAGVPKGWKIRKMPFDSLESGRIQVSAPGDHHCMVERIPGMAPHHPMNMLVGLCEALMATQPQPQEPLTHEN
jgi:hypothetical protein